MVDLTYSEQSEKPAFLEGTGVCVLDRVNKIAYMCKSPRADSYLASIWAEKMGYELFDAGIAQDPKTERVYHTNVIMTYVLLLLVLLIC
jgi:hypothetical protein